MPNSNSIFGLGKLFGKREERWSVLQIEVTSRCPMHCSFCPNKSLGRQWVFGDLSFEDYRDHIAPHLARFDLAYLQGWGEPLLHPHIWEMVQLAQAQRCRVGFTTCGNKLDEETCVRLLDEKIDLLSISFAGATRETHEALRVGSSFDKLCANVTRLTQMRTARKNKLRLELHFLMMRANLHELPAFVQLAKSLGADEVVATNVAYTPTREIEATRVFANTPDLAHQDWVAEANDQAQRVKLKFNAYPLKLDPNVLECDAKPTTTAFVNHRGEVAPCVYLGIPVHNLAPRVFEGQTCAFAPVSFGNVRDGLIEAMLGEARKNFVQPIRQRRSAALLALAVASDETDKQLVRIPEPPAPCRYCPKMYGV